MLKLIFKFSITAFLMSGNNLISSSIIIYKKNFSSKAGYFIHEQDQKARYVIPIQEVQSFLPAEHNIKRRSIKLMDDHVVPGKMAIRVFKHFMFDRQNTQHIATTKDIFSSLEQEKPHTYVVMLDRLIFTESTSNPSLEILKDKCTKHFLISGLVKRVHYSGEFFVYKNSVNDEIFVVFDNSSGTYQPPTELLPQLQQLLNYNLNSSVDDNENIFILTKSYEQRTDKDKLFNHEGNPFI